jgi:VanZ family protein
MKNTLPNNSRTHLHRYLTAAYILFITYVSLSPFTGWKEQGLFFSDVLTAPLAQTFTGFDFSLNILAYLPLGFLLAYMMRGHRSAPRVLFLSTFSGLVMSLSMEYAQMYLPTRVSSNTDLISNVLGTFIGAICALLIVHHAWFSRIKVLHHRWFKHGGVSDFGLALLAVWVFAQTNPSLPMLGSVFISEVARWPYDIVPQSPFNWLECIEVALNLLLLEILLSTLLREQRHMMNALLAVLCTVTLIKFIAAAVLLKSWALLLWMNSEAMIGIIAGLLFLVPLLRLSRLWLLGLGALSAIFYLLLMQDLLLANKSSAPLRLYHWHYIHMLNYNGFSQLTILLFPVLLLVYLWRTGILRK